MLTYRTSLGTPGAAMDAVPRRRLLFRIQNLDRHPLVDNAGFGWLDLSVSLTDSNGDTATLALNDRLPAAPLHPSPDPPESKALLKYQRYITVGISLADFTSANPDLDLI